jgi:hypothetical protein
MATTESGSLMKLDNSMGTPGIGPEFQLFVDCKCPRALSLIREVFRPVSADYFSFTQHLLQTTVFELYQGHLDINQAMAIYARITEVHNWNLAKCDFEIDGNFQSGFYELKLNLQSGFADVSEKFHKYVQPLSEKSNQKIAVQPLCNEILEPTVIGRENNVNS